MPSVLTLAATDIAAYDGPHAIPGIRFRAARQALGVTAWGMNLLELDPGCDLYPEHDHVADGQEEVYVMLSGEATLVTPEGEHPLRTGDLCRVSPEVRRKIVPGPQGAVVLALGATPGAAFVPTL